MRACAALVQTESGVRTLHASARPHGIALAHAPPVRCGAIPPCGQTVRGKLLAEGRADEGVSPLYRPLPSFGEPNPGGVAVGRG